MPVYWLGEEVIFPAVEEAEDGLLAIGGDLRPERLLRAYSEGIFPWYSEGQPILWHTPDPRFVLTAEDLHVPKSLSRTLRSGLFSLTLDTAFREVVEQCAKVPRSGQSGTWITPDMMDAYAELHRQGFAHSVETWRGEELAGGLYGVSLGGTFFGESMFANVDDASKIAFVALVEQLARWNITLVDCQVYTEHLARFGAEHWSRERYLAALRAALMQPTRRGPWRLEAQ